MSFISLWGTVCLSWKGHDLFDVESTAFRFDYNWLGSTLRVLGGLLAAIVLLACYWVRGHDRKHPYTLWTHRTAVLVDAAALAWEIAYPIATTVIPIALFCLMPAGIVWGVLTGGFLDLDLFD